MYALRLWSVRHSRGLNLFYTWFERGLIALHPLWAKIGYERLEPAFAGFERASKGLLFDCQMCGQCVLSSTGMSCPMNCPKNLRNGPCGGVLDNGNCEVKPEMKCVWAQAWLGAEAMGNPGAILVVQKPVDNRLKGRSSWLRVVRIAKGLEDAPANKPPPQKPAAAQVAPPTAPPAAPAAAKTEAKAEAQAESPSIRRR